jgi:hypothetical protein
VDAGATWTSGRVVLVAVRGSAESVGEVGAEGSSCDS